MRALRRLLTALLGLLFVFDVLIAYRFWLYRPWKTIVTPREGFLGQLGVATTWTGLDFFILGLLVILQIGLAYYVGRSWRSKPIKYKRVKQAARLGEEH